MSLAAMSLETCITCGPNTLHEWNRCVRCCPRSRPRSLIPDTSKSIVRLQIRDRAAYLAAERQRKHRARVKKKAEEANKHFAEYAALTTKGAWRHGR